jgi:Lrp/AsnC family leucine-responsive transcriptional regulator
MYEPTQKTLDRIDRRILTTLQDNGRISNVELARAINLSPTPCLERVRRLESAGYIEGYSARLSAEKLGMGLTVFVQLTLDRTKPDVFDRFRDAIAKIPEIAECHMVAGGFDYLLKIRISDMNAYRNMLGDKLAALKSVLNTHSYVVMEEVKNDRSLKVPD